MLETQVSVWCKTKEELQGMADSLHKRGYVTSWKKKKLSTGLVYSLYRHLTWQEKEDVQNKILVLEDDFLSFKQSDKRGKLPSARRFGYVS